MNYKLIDEEKYKDISAMLKKLPKVKAGDDFMQKLEMKISNYDAGIDSSIKKIKKEEEGFFSRIIGQKKNPWLVPAMGLAVVAIFVFYVSNFNNVNTIPDSNTGKINNEKDIENNNTLKNTIPPSDNNLNSDKKSEFQDKVTIPKDIPEIKNRDLIPLPNTAKESDKKSYNKTETSQNPPSEQKYEVNTIEEKGGDYYEGKTGNETGKAEDILKEESNARGSISNESLKLKSSDTSKSPDKKQEEFENKIDSKLLEKLNNVNKKNLDSLSKKVNRQKQSSDE